MTVSSPARVVVASAAPSPAHRVVHLAPGHVPFDSRVFHKEARTLADAGYTVTVVAPHEGDTIVERVRVVGLPRATGRFDRFVRGPWRLYRAARRADGDVYHLHDIEAVPVGLLLKARGYRVIWDSHEDYPRLTVDRSWIPAPLRKPLGRVVAGLERVAARRVDAIISAEDEGARRFPPEKTVVVRNLPLAREFGDPGPPLSQRANTLVYVGDVTRQRGAMEMLDVLDRLDPELDARLVLVGPISDPALADEMRDHPAWRRVDHRGRQGRDGVVASLHEAKVGLVLLHPIRKYAEGAVPVKLFEYAAAGVPAVASDFPALRSVVETMGCGALVDPLGVEAVAAAVERLLKAPPEALDREAAVGRDRVLADCTWETEAATLLTVYAELDSLRRVRRVR